MAISTELEASKAYLCMNMPTKTLMTIEHHSLQLVYAPLRLHRRPLINKLMTSIEEHGQLVPVVVVPSGHNQWMLMDGYVRVNALRHLGKDTVNAEAWNCDPSEALLILLTEHQSRPWEAIEEALLLQELHTQHKFSQNDIAARVGRDKSWVSRRLSLLDGLSESIREAMISDKLSLWSATRVLVPLARANAEHAESLLNHLLKHVVSTRSLGDFYHHYQRSNHQQRSKMVNDLDLFFKAQASLIVEKQTQQLQAGPEGQWCSKLRLIKKTLQALTALTASVLTPPSKNIEHCEAIEVFNQVATEFELLTKSVRRFVDV